MIAPRSAPAANGSPAGAIGDLTPLIDVLFMLIVFMVLTANAAERALDAGFASTEEAIAAPQAGERALMIEIGAANSSMAFAVDDRRFVDWPAAKAVLTARLAADAGPEGAPPVQVAVAADAPAQRMIDLMSFLQARGVADAEIVLRSR
ncbi:MAG: biopolymer transporter ExbD [Alphaproteobacteria bacterium]|nr:biopolymer transporter ExbD [Alphaproteobacteria bacterium]